MTPNDIEILIHCYVSPTPHPRLDAPAVREAIEQFLHDGLIQEYGDAEGVYCTTAKGSCHVQQLCNVPLPKQHYIGYDGKVIQL